jgi:hypothetical protein
MTEMVVGIILVMLFLGAVASLFYRIFFRLRQIEETLLEEILRTKEMIVDNIYETKKIARALNVAKQDNDEEWS